MALSVGFTMVYLSGDFLLGNGKDRGRLSRCCIMYNFALHCDIYVANLAWLRI